MSNEEKLIKINTLLILILNYRLDKSLGYNEIFKASVFELKNDICFIFPQKDNIHMEMCSALIRKFLDEISDIHEDNPRMTEYHQAYHSQMTQKQRNFEEASKLSGQGETT